MIERIRHLVEMTLRGEMYVLPVKTEFDRKDLFLTKEERDVKRLCEYIRNQEPKLTEYSRMTGFFHFDGTVVGDAFQRGGHVVTREAMQQFYLKPIDNLSTMEWQHATADYRMVLSVGLRGIIDTIRGSMANHPNTAEQNFLSGLQCVAEALIDWSHKCAARAAEFAANVTDNVYRRNLEKLSETLLRVPEYAPQTFYEAVVCIYLCFSADPDSIGLIDRYLWDFYKRDTECGILTKDEAKEYLQELFLMLQAATPFDSDRFTRGGESHFCVGGYLEDGSDGFTELSALIVDALLELPTYIPQITFRWTKKTPRDIFYYIMDCERRDPYKRIAFTNDDRRLQCYMKICGFSYENAIFYTMVGCNEPAFPGSTAGDTSKGNFLRAIETLFHQKADLIRNIADFDLFYHVYEKEMYADLDTILSYDDRYNEMRGRDLNYISSLFSKDCIVQAKSITQGGSRISVASPKLMGITNVIDSLITVRQFVYDEKIVTMTELIEAVQSDWVGYEQLHLTICKRGSFFGNDDARSNEIAHRVYNSLYRFLSGKKNLFGYPILVGDLLGYNLHHKWFGEKMKATPDGRKNGEPLKFGIGQSEGRDRNGLTALLNSIATADPDTIACGSTVTNVLIDGQLIKNDSNFEKTVILFETYFRNGGTHFQLTYVSPEELRKAKKKPDAYGNLRVRVSGFSDYFVRLNEGLQDDVIRRTEQKL